MWCLKSWENQAFKAERPKWSLSGMHKQQIRSLTQKQRDREVARRTCSLPKHWDFAAKQRDKTDTTPLCCAFYSSPLRLVNFPCRNNAIGWVADPQYRDNFGLHLRVYWSPNRLVAPASLMVWRSASLAPAGTAGTWNSTVPDASWYDMIWLDASW